MVCAEPLPPGVLACPQCAYLIEPDRDCDQCHGMGLVLVRAVRIVHRPETVEDRQ